MNCPECNKEMILSSIVVVGTKAEEHEEYSVYYIETETTFSHCHSTTTIRRVYDKGSYDQGGMNRPNEFAKLTTDVVDDAQTLISLFNKAK